MFERDWSGAEENYKKAIELNPNYATSRQWYALYLINVGRKKEALEMVIKAEQLDPTSMIIKSVLGLQYQGVGEEELALKFSNEALKMSPLFGGALRTKYILLDTEDIDEGIAKYQEALKINKDPIDPRMGLLRLHLKKGDQRAALNEFAEIIGYPKVTIEQCGIVAQMYYYLGKSDVKPRTCGNRDGSRHGVCGVAEGASLPSDVQKNKPPDVCRQVSHECRGFH